MSEGGEPKQNTQNLLYTSPMSEGGEPKQNTQSWVFCLGSPPSDIGDVRDFEILISDITSPMI